MYEEELKMYLTIEAVERLKTISYIAGCITGAVGMLILGFVSLWVLGAFIPD